MKKFIYIFVILFLCFNLEAGDNRIFAGVSGGYGSFSDYSGKASFEVSAGYKLTGNLMLLLNAGYVAGNTDADAEDFSGGKLHTVPLELSVRYQLKKEGKLIPWLSAGGGYYLNGFSLDGNIKKSYSDQGFEVTESVKNRLGLTLGAGIDYAAGSSVTLVLSVKYVNMSSPAGWSIKDVRSGVTRKGEFDSSLNQIRVMAGFGLNL